jgi:RNase H-fold protein (predicted Holliday junction resolvase)
MKYRLYLLLAILTISVTSEAQTVVGQFFNQNKTQKKYLLDQIAALQVYKGYLKNGYTVAKDGTGLIGRIKDGDHSLHSGHFDSLSRISSKVRNYSKVKAIVAMQKQMEAEHLKAGTRINNSILTSLEKGQYNKIYRSVLNRSIDELSELQLVVTDGRVKMSDDERLKFIDKIYTEMLGCLSSARKINSQFLALAAQRDRERKDNQSLKNLYN